MTDYKYVGLAMNETSRAKLRRGITEEERAVAELASVRDKAVGSVVEARRVARAKESAREELENELQRGIDMRMKGF